MKTLDIARFKLYLEIASTLPAVTPAPDPHYILDTVDRTSHVGAFMAGYSDGSVAGQQALIHMILEYLEDHTH